MSFSGEGKRSEHATAATVPREQYERVVAALDHAVETLDIATEVIQSEGKLPQRAVLSDKLLTATRELRAKVAAAITKDCGCSSGESCDRCD